MGNQGLRNIFDQYQVPENRVTNALLQTLQRDKRLLDAFLKKVIGRTVAKNEHIVFEAFKKPGADGDLKSSDEQTQSIPDGLIKIGENIAVAIESKIVKNAIRPEQLRSHLREVASYNEKYLCVITPDDSSPIEELKARGEIGVNSIWLSWREIYEMLGDYKSPKNAEEFLQNQLKEFLYMQNDLIGFCGIKKWEEGYDLEQANNIVRNLIRAIKPKLQEIYQGFTYEKQYYKRAKNPYQIYREWAWGYLAPQENFTKDLHFTFSLSETNLFIGLTIPHNAGQRWRRLKQICKDDNLFQEFESLLFELRSTLPNIYLEFLQRHYVGRKDGLIDGMIEMNLDTIHGNPEKNVKENKALWEGLRSAIARKKDYNGQLMIRTRYFFKDHPEMEHESFKDEIIRATASFKPIYEFLSESK